MITGAFCKLRNGTQGVRVNEPIDVGATVTVRGEDGKYELKTVTYIERAEAGIVYCGWGEVVSSDAPWTCPGCQRRIPAGQDCRRCQT